MFARVFPLFIVVVAALPTGNAAWAQDASPGGGGTYEGEKIAVTVAPNPAFVGGDITLSGWVLPAIQDRTVKVRLDGPAGRKAVEEFECEEDGRYEWTWGPLDEPGTWRVRMQGPAAPELADTTFDVYPAAQAPANMAIGMDEALDAGQATLEQVNTDLTGYPQAPGKDEAVQRGRTAQEKTEELRVQVAEMNAGLQALASSMAASPAPLPELTAAVVAQAATIQEQQQTINQGVARMKAGLNDARRETMWCKMWYSQGMVLKEFVGLIVNLMSITKSVTSFARNQAEEALKKDISRVAWQNYTPEQQALIRECEQDGHLAIKRIHQAFDPVSALSDILVELINKQVDWLVADLTKHCKIYAGPVKGDLRIDYYARGEPYMRVRYRVEAKAELFFKPREGSGAPVRLEGKIRGHAHSFIGSTDIRHLVRDIPATSGLGFCLPKPVWQSFYMTVEGEARDDRMTLRIKEVFDDFSPAQYRFVFLILSAYQLVPLPDFVTINVPGAEWFFTRGTSTAGDEKFFELPITAAGDASKAVKQFEREMDYKDDRDFMGYINIDFDLSCPPPDSY